MQGLVLSEYNNNIIRALFTLEVVEKENPLPKDNEVLIKIDAAPINPSDIAFIRGSYNIKKDLPKVLGFEGTGTVVKSGSDPDSQILLGKRVSCFTQDNVDGTWADYFVTRNSNCISVKDELSVDQAAGIFINPFTAYAIYRTCLEKGNYGIIQNAAAGQVGRFIRRFAQKDGIPVINLVRKSQHIEKLQEQGEKYVFDVTDDRYRDELSELAKRLNVRTVIDAVGGKLTGELFGLIPDNSDVILYGGLAGLDIGEIDPLDIIFHNKRLIGFNLLDWMGKKSKVEVQKIADHIQDMVIRKEIETTIQKTFPLDNAKAAFKTYIGDMSGGKILLKP